MTAPTTPIDGWDEAIYGDEPHLRYVMLDQCCIEHWEFEKEAHALASVGMIECPTCGIRMSQDFNRTWGISITSADKIRVARAKAEKELNALQKPS